METVERVRRTRKPRRLGLRSRVTLVFSVGALLLAAVMATLAFELARNYLLNERVSSARRQTFSNARLVRSGLRAANVDVTAFLGTVPTGTDSDALVYRRGHWFGTSVGVGPAQLPADLVSKALGGSAAVQRFGAGGSTDVGVAVPLPAVDSVYFQVYSLRELNSTLHILSASLAVAALVTAMAGALVGSWASKRALQPVRDVARAAGNIADGRLSTRLRVDEDPDLLMLANAFNAMVDALQARLARDARFASDISHELRSPLTTLATSLTVLGRNTANWSDSQLQALELMTAETTAFQHLVADLLEISRVDAGASTPVWDDVIAGEFARNVAAIVLPGVPVEIDPDAEQLPLRTDKRRLERVVANLAQNADRYAGGVVRFHLARCADGRRVRFEVDDAGPGVPAADRARIFERFARGGAGRRAPGTGVGLGLAIVAEHATTLGGAAFVEDRPGGGARFVIEVPVSPA
jgi:two-component system sensor histidine kinase MtrB